MHPFRQVAVIIFILFFKSSWCKIASAARNWNHSVLQSAPTTFAFSSKFDRSSMSHRYQSINWLWERISTTTAALPAHEAEDGLLPLPRGGDQGLDLVHSRLPVLILSEDNRVIVQCTCLLGNQLQCHNFLKETVSREKFSNWDCGGVG